MTVTATVDIKVKATHSLSTDLATYRGSPKLEYNATVASPTKVFADTRTAAATADNIDLRGGVTDAFGTTLTFSSLQTLMIVNESATDSLTLFAGSTAVIGGSFVLSAGKTWFSDSVHVVDATHKIIKCDPSSATVTFSIIVVGT